MHDATVDPREVDYYSRLADTWWDESGPFWPLHKLNELRSEYISRRLSDRLDRNASAARPLDGLKILDVGCGGGILSESMASRGATVTGIDVVEKNIRVAELHARQRGLDIEYRLCPVADIAADEQNRFDVVLNMEVVEHVNDVPGFMRDCCRSTASDGVMFVSTINRTPLAWLFAIVGAEYVLGWLPRGTHQWSRFQKPADIERHLNSNGLVVEQLTGVKANPLTRTLSLTGSTRVNYMLMASRAR